jgi:hypothetical protein
MPIHLPLVPSPGKDLFYPHDLHSLNVYTESPGGFHLGLSDMYISCFNQINHPVTYSFFITLFPYYSTGYSALHCIVFICRWNASIFFINILFLSPTSCSTLRLTPNIHNGLLFSHKEE